MLAIAPLVGLFLISTAAFAAFLVKSALNERTAPVGTRTTPKEGEVVKFVPVGASWVVKVFREHKQYSVDVIHSSVFQVHKGGFGSIAAAEGWGVNYAKERGA